MQDSIAELLSFTKKDGKYVKETADVGDDFVDFVRGMSHKEALSFMSTLLDGKRSHEKYGELTGAHIAMVLTYVNSLAATKESKKPKPFTVSILDDGKTKQTMINSGSASKVRIFEGGFEGGRDPVAVYARFLTSSVAFSKQSADHAVILTELPKPSDAASAFTTNYVGASTVVRSVFGGDVNTISKLEEETEAFLGLDDVCKKMSSLYQASIPKNLKPIVSDVSAQLSNSVLTEVPDKHLRPNSQLFEKVATTDKYGPGYYNQGHYDGTLVTGPTRNILEMLYDFDFTASQRIIRLTTSDPAKAHALFNACKHKGIDVLVLYESKSSGTVSEYWNGSSVVKHGILPCDNVVFQSCFGKHLGKVYYYDLSCPEGTPRYSALGVYSSNRKLVSRSAALTKYGYYSYYTNLSHLITNEEIEMCKKIDPSLEVNEIFSASFAPSCKVRKGFIRVTKTGNMDYAAAFRNVISGKLHYLTWLYRSYPFAFKGCPGDTHFQPVDVHYDPNVPDDAANATKRIVEAVWKLLPPEVQSQVDFSPDEGKPPQDDDDEEDEEQEENDDVNEAANSLLGSLQPLDN